MRFRSSAACLRVIDPLRQLIASDQGLFLRDTQTGDVQPRRRRWRTSPATARTTAAFIASGSLWIGTMGRSAEKAAGAIYHVAGTQVTRLYDRHHHSQQHLLFA